jgi:hypothetical protein
VPGVPNYYLPFLFLPKKSFPDTAIGMLHTTRGMVGESFFFSHFFNDLLYFLKSPIKYRTILPLEESFRLETVSINKRKGERERRGRETQACRVTVKEDERVKSP